MSGLFKKLVVFISLTLFVNCAGLQPLYNTEQDVEVAEILANVDVKPIGGRYGVVLRNELKKVFGTKDRESQEILYTLQADISIGSTKFTFYNADGTSSSPGVKIYLNYELYDELDCLIFSVKNTTKANYNTQSGGYDYGNKASEKSAIIKNIEYNVKLTYPLIYKAIKFKQKRLPFIPPYLFLDDFKGCI
tara:strand:- start:93 stop:665 length:573 start_codon:yes stop_codon:yes gene_type:complete